MLSTEHLVFDGNRWTLRPSWPSVSAGVGGAGSSSSSSGGGPQARVLQHRTASDISTSLSGNNININNNNDNNSNIIVATAPQPAATTPPSVASSGVQDAMETRSRVFARLVNGRVLVIQMKGYHNKQFFTRLVQGRGGRRVSAVKATQLSPVASSSIKDDAIQARPARPTAVVADDNNDDDDDADDGDNDDDHNNDNDFDDDNPNGRGTFSRAYADRHPEVEWVHRGQGRYLPANAAAARKLNIPATNAARGSLTPANPSPICANDTASTRTDSPSASKHQQSSDTHTDRNSLVRENSADPIGSHSGDDHGRRRRRRKSRPRLSHTHTAPQTPEIDRRPSRITAAHNLNYYIKDDDNDLGTNSDDDDEDDDDNNSDKASDRDNPSGTEHGGSEADGMGGDKEPTFDKEYVDAHPTEQFYHTGNGWYKKGKRPRALKRPKIRDASGHAVGRSADGQFYFDPDQTIHVSQISHYPGVEFHHCGNGWYKPGPDHTGHRQSTVVEKKPIDVVEKKPIDVVEKKPIDAAHTSHENDLTVNKAYTLKHPEIEWVHRGNGRYRRKSTVPPSAARSSRYASSQEPIGDEYDDDNDDDDDDGDDAEDYYRGSDNRLDDLLPPRYDETIGHSTRNTRAGRTLLDNGTDDYYADQSIDHGARSRRRLSMPTDDSTLYSKAYVRAHPGESFHHRGQGRYARGPRPKLVDDSVEAEAQETLVDTEYVEAHPEETFHHRGQGRWARGMPPPGSSNKVAIRGPGAKDRAEGSATAEKERDDGVQLPPLSALLLKSEGPDKYPQVKWHYRGGGKWARITKQDWVALQENTHSRAQPGTQGARTRYGGTGGTQAITSAGAETADPPRKRRRRFSPDDEDDEMGLDADDDLAPVIAPKRQLAARPSLGGPGKRTQSKMAASEAPSPRPRVMSLSEDELNDEDLPGLYKQSWSPSDSEADDEAGRILRANFKPLRRTEDLLAPLTKFDPRTRPTENLLRLAAYGQQMLDGLQREYLESDKITAQHARIPRRPAKGGRLPVDSQIFEDRKEADLYDYHFDMRRLGYQDPVHQRIQRDADGRELRGRRNRTSAAQQSSTALPPWEFGDDTVGSRRTLKPITRLDGFGDQSRRRGRQLNTASGTTVNSRAASATPDAHAPTPLERVSGLDYVPRTTGRWAGHIPKRIQELRRESEGPSAGPLGHRPQSPSQQQRDQSPGASSRKGRPPGSKNLHKRRDAGIKKGPRKPKSIAGGDDAASITQSETPEVEGSGGELE